MSETIQITIGDVSNDFYNLDEQKAEGISLKYAKKLLDITAEEPILVISGDCVCDYDFTDITEYHKNTRHLLSFFLLLYSHYFV